jgi:cytidine deaminase
MMARKIATLLKAAKEARLRAHAPFSHFLVGAALEAEDGKVITGCNIENASYGLTICAERVAVFKAISEGYRKFTRIVIVAESESMIVPCGACRQILWEFCGDIEVHVSNRPDSDGASSFRLRDFFPMPFDAGNL